MDPSTRTLQRKRWVAAGVIAGGLAGAVVGAQVLTAAAPDRAAGPRPTILHAAPALVRAGSEVVLTLTSVCDTPDAASCQVSGARALIEPAATPGAVTAIGGSKEEGVYRFRIPADLVPDGGFAYAFQIRTADGGSLTYPPGAGSRIRVLTTHGLPAADLPAFSWADRLAPAGSIARLAVGSGPGQVGLTGVGEEGGESGPSSFDVTLDGGVVVADWVHARALRFSASGGLIGSFPLPPGRPLDITVAGAGVVAATLGVGAQVYELGPDGSVTGRYDVGYGVASRVIAGVSPRVRVGAAQWVPVRSVPGAGLTAEAQAAAETTTVPLADGSVGVSSVLEDRLAFAWTRPDGSRAGVALRLPAGVRPGADYFVHPTPDGGALAVQGLWDDAHFGVAAVVFDAGGALSAFHLLPEPTTRMAAPFSTVRYGGPGVVVMAVDMGDGMRIDRFEVR